MRAIARLCLLPALAWAAAAAGQTPRAPAVTIEVPVLPQAATYLELLTVPTYLALVLENNGLSPSLSSRVAIKDRRSFSIRAGTVRFVERNGPVFRYEGSLTVPLGIAEPGFTVPVEVDTTGIDQGKVILRAYSGLSAMLPQALVERVEFKLRALANVAAQRKVLAYLDGLPREHAPSSSIEPMLEAIVFDAYNRSGGPAAGAEAVDRGQAETLSDQSLLILTVVIWLICFPVLFLLVRRHRKLRQAG